LRYPNGHLAPPAAHPVLTTTVASRKTDGPKCLVKVPYPLSLAVVTGSDLVRLVTDHHQFVLTGSTVVT
jgi:hypothetical protein